jgi:hypothetical protein
MSWRIKYLLHAVFLDVILLNHSLALISELGFLVDIYTVPLSAQKNPTKGDYKKQVCQRHITRNKCVGGRFNDVNVD